MKQNTLINTLLKRPLWVVMAVLCIVFSSATKKLIELKMAPYFTVSATVGKRIKDHSRDRRQYLHVATPAAVQAAPDLNPQQVFFLSALISFALLFLFQSDKRTSSFALGIARFEGNEALYLQYRQLRI